MGWNFTPTGPRWPEDEKKALNGLIDHLEQFGSRQFPVQEGVVAGKLGVAVLYCNTPILMWDIDNKNIPQNQTDFDIAVASAMSKFMATQEGS